MLAAPVAGYFIGNSKAQVEAMDRIEAKFSG
jgi:hypothetical protein